MAFDIPTGRRPSPIGSFLATFFRAREQKQAHEREEKLRKEVEAREDRRWKETLARQDTAAEAGLAEKMASLYPEQAPQYIGRASDLIHGRATVSAPPFAGTQGQAYEQGRGMMLEGMRKVGNTVPRTTYLPNALAGITPGKTADELHFERQKELAALGDQNALELEKMRSQGVQGRFDVEQQGRRRSELADLVMKAAGGLEGGEARAVPYARQALETGAYDQGEAPRIYGIGPVAALNTPGKPGLAQSLYGLRTKEQAAEELARIRGDAALERAILGAGGTTNRVTTPLPLPTARAEAARAQADRATATAESIRQLTPERIANIASQIKRRGASTDHEKFMEDIAGQRADAYAEFLRAGTAEKLEMAPFRAMSLYYHALAPQLYSDIEAKRLLSILSNADYLMSEYDKLQKPDDAYRIWKSTDEARAEFDKLADRRKRLFNRAPAVPGVGRPAPPPKTGAKTAPPLAGGQRTATGGNIYREIYIPAKGTTPGFKDRISKQRLMLLERKGWTRAELEQIWNAGKP